MKMVSTKLLSFTLLLSLFVFVATIVFSISQGIINLDKAIWWVGFFFWMGFYGIFFHMFYKILYQELDKRRDRRNKIGKGSVE